MLENYFNISEYCIESGPIPQHIADAILVHHILPMNMVRAEMKVPIYVSHSSGYRSEKHEKSKGRPGTSEHTFKYIWPTGQGAADYTTHEPATLERLFEKILKYTKYTRVCIYPFHNFIHCDYKPSTTRTFTADKQKNWQRK